MSELAKEESMLKTEHFPESSRRIIEVIERIRGQGGEEYQGSGSAEHKSRRNPVKSDTAPLLTAYAALTRPKRVFEMGTAYGFSALHIGLGSPRSRILTVEFEPDVAKEAQMTLDDAGLDSSVFTGTVAEAITHLDKPIDFVFIDHDKGSYLPDFQALEPHLSTGALVLADNVNDRRTECADFVEYAQARYEGVLLPTEAGLLVFSV